MMKNIVHYSSPCCFVPNKVQSLQERVAFGSSVGHIKAKGSAVDAGLFIIGIKSMKQFIFCSYIRKENKRI